MKHSTRLLLCRLGFVLLCALPTAATIGWLSWQNFRGSTVASKEDWQRVLTNQLGLIATIDEVCHAPEEVTQLLKLQLAEVETNAVVATAGEIQIADSSDATQIAISRLVIEANQIPVLMRLLEERILRGQTPPTTAGMAAHRVQFLPSDILIHQPGHDQSLVQCSMWIELRADGVTFDCQFQIPGSTAAAPIRLTAVRERSNGIPTTRWQIDTADNELPLALIAHLVPGLPFGRDCRFRGRAEFTSDHLTGRLQGVLSHVDLDSLVTERLPHQLNGIATVRIDEAVVQRGKLAAIRGTIEATSGSISNSLVAAAAQHLGVTSAAEPPADGQSITSFRRLAIEFQLTGNSLSLTGSADPLTPGVLLTSAAGPISIAPPQHRVAAINLLRTLLPDSGYQVPATRQTEALVHLFPVPEISSARLAQQPLHTPTRLAPATAASPSSPTTVRPPVLR